MLARRRHIVIGMLAGAAITSAGGLVVARFIRSPQQAAADTAPPAVSTLTAVVELRVLKDTVVTRGTVGAGGAFEVTPIPATGANPVVTRVLTKAGNAVSPAKPLVEVAGRPLFALAGELPVYRDLRPADTGQDVAQLQRALKDLGYGQSDPNGVFGPGTKLSIIRLYRQLGYAPLISGDAASLEAAAQQVVSAQRALAEAQERLDQLQANPPSPAPGQPDPLQQARRAVQHAEEDLNRASVASGALQAAYGPMIPSAEVVFLPSFPARVDAITAVVGKLVQAPLLTLSSGALVVRAKLSPGQGDLLRPGMAVEVVSELLGLRSAAVISSIGELTQEGSSGRHIPMLITASTGSFDAKLVGQNVRLTIEAAATDGAVLVVPLSALYAGADGRTAVQVLGVNGEVVRVEVTPNSSGDGYVAVTPVNGSLKQGDRVVVGIQSRATP